MHIRALAGVNIVHLFIFCCSLLLFQVVHVGVLFYLWLTQAGGLVGRRPSKTISFCAVLRARCASSTAQKSILGAAGYPLGAVPQPPTELQVIFTPTSC